VTSDTELFTASGLNSSVSTAVKMAVFAPMPSAKEKDGHASEEGIANKTADAVTQVLKNGFESTKKQSYLLRKTFVGRIRNCGLARSRTRTTWYQYL
jgi:hypothetical protein